MLIFPNLFTFEVLQFSFKVIAMVLRQFRQLTPLLGAKCRSKTFGPSKRTNLMPEKLYSDSTGAGSGGAGGNFCAGYDLKMLANQKVPVKLEQDVTKGPGPMGPSRLRLSKPLIAAVSGFAVAGGLELALLADLRVVEQSAVMGVFCRRFGVPLIDGGTVRLPHLIGLSRALDLILTGRPVGAQEALAYGLANRVVPDGQALEAALQLAEQISAFPQRCLRADRSSAVYSCYDAQTFTQAMQYEFDHGVTIIQAEAVPGAIQFTAGAGRGGKFS